MLPVSTMIDWVSFTVPYDENVAIFGTSPSRIGQAVDTFFTLGEVFSGLWLDHPYEHISPRKPYRHTVRFPSAGVLYAWGGQEHALIEVQAQGCRLLEQNGALYAVAQAVARRATRLDLAVDLVGTSPDDVILAMDREKVSSGSSARSKTGTTHYVGSRASASFMRVYQYNEPHPRAAFTRIEVQYNKRKARVAMAMISPENLTKMLQHELSQKGLGERITLDDSQLAIRTPRANRTEAGTLLWLIDTVAPSFIKLCRAGIIEDPEAFLLQNFLDPLRLATLAEAAQEQEAP